MVSQVPAVATAGNMTALEAYEAGSLGLSFGGAGLLLIYYVGILKVFEQLGIIIMNAPSPPVGGSSSGSIIAGTVCSGLPAEELHKLVSEFIHDCRDKSCAGRLDKAVHDVLDKYLPPESGERCKGRIVTTLTLMRGYTQLPTAARTNEIGGTFSNRTDLIATLAASSYMPYYSGTSFSTAWHDKRVADGSLAGPSYPCPPNVGYCIQMSIIPVLAQAPSYSQCTYWMSRAWLNVAPWAASLKKPALPERPPKVTPATVDYITSRNLDIAPGLALGNTGIDPMAWYEMIYIPCDAATCDYAYRLGMLDALAWAEETGIAAAAAKKRASKAAGSR